MSRAATARRVAPPPRRRHLAPVAEGGVSIGLLTIVGILLFMGTLLASVAVQTLLFEARIGVDDLDTEIALEQEHRAQLLAEVATLESPARIQDAAKSQLGMDSAAGRTYLAPVVPGNPDSPIPPPGEDPFGRAPDPTAP